MTDLADRRQLSQLFDTQRKLMRELADVNDAIAQCLLIPPAPSKKAPPDPQVKAFLLWFQTEYKTRRNGADYFIVWGKHGALVKELLGVTPYERLQTLAKILLSDKTDDPFIVETDRGIEILKVKFNWLSDRLAAYEARKAKG